MNATRRLLRYMLRRCYVLLEASFEVMARYPHDLTELHWNTDLFEPPHHDGDGGAGKPSQRQPRIPDSGRSIKIVPPPASKRYHAARPTRVQMRHQPRRKQPV